MLIKIEKNVRRMFWIKVALSYLVFFVATTLDSISTIWLLETDEERSEYNSIARWFHNKLGIRRGESTF